MQQENRPYLFIDGMNIFVRHYLVNQETNNKSEPVGGVVGFLKTIDYLAGWLSPSRIYVVWEAGGATNWRRRIHENYKKNKGKIKEAERLKNGNATIRDQLKNDEECKINQLYLLNKLLKQTPICQVFVKGTECDDVIAYLASEHFKTDPTQKIIVSSDKDFYQLLGDDSIIIYDPAKKDFIDAKLLKETYNIAPRNFCLARALVGDTSDNLEGVPGMGLKTAAKRFTKLADEDYDMDIEDILEECRNQIANKSKVKIYQSICQAEHIVRRNYRLMHLSSNQLSASQIRKVEGALEFHEPKMNKMALVKEVLSAGIAISFDFERFSSRLRNSLHY